MIERFRAWLHRDCRLQASRLTACCSANASALLSVGEQLGQLSGGILLLRQSLEKVPERVTVIAFGQRYKRTIEPAPDMAHLGSGAGEQDGEPEPLIILDSKTVRLRGTATETIELRANFPVDRFQLLILANLDRVELRGVFHNSNLLGMESPIAFGKSWQPGELVRAIVQRREAGA